MTIHRDEAIDYLRGISIILIIVLHIIGPHDINLKTYYLANSKALFYIRDYLQFVVVTIVVCSGYSLFMRHRSMEMTLKGILKFYTHRIKRLFLPWWYFCIAYFAFHYILRAAFDIHLVTLSREFIISSLRIGIGGITYGWIILLILIASLLFPFLQYAFQKIGAFRFLSIATILFLIGHIYYLTGRAPSGNIHDIPFHATFPVQSGYFLLLFFGWTLVYVFGFTLVHLFKDRNKIEIELKLMGFFFLVYVITMIVFRTIGFDDLLTYSKYPPNLLYVSYGLFVSMLLAIIFFKYKPVIHRHLKRILMFFSINSLWLYLWHILAIDAYEAILIGTGVKNRMAFLPINILFVFFITLGILFAQKKLVSYESTHIRI